MVKPKKPKTLAAIKNSTTVFRTKIIDPANYQGRLLKSAEHNRKLGNGKYTIEKGKWKGYPLFYLTLVERETCPSSCHHWDDCYGNSMWLGTRFKHGPALEEKLQTEIKQLANQYKAFVVRLHVLGDFYSESYVKMWSDMVERYPELHIFGYTAIHSGPIYEAIRASLLTQFERVKLRFSVNNNASDMFNPFDSIPHYFAVDEDHSKPAIVCPEMVGKTDSCLTCALCWSNSNSIKFLSH